MRFSYDGQGVIMAGGRVIARDDPSNATARDDLAALVRRANAAKPLFDAINDLVGAISLARDEGEEIPEWLGEAEDRAHAAMAEHGPL